jgi:TRAP-type mannitol/chloroaromatic compound transport system substrate-binding protein
MKTFMRLIVICVFAACAASQALAAEKYQWRMASAWGEGIKVLEADRSFAEKVEKMSGGRLVIKVFPSGQICPTNQVLDVVRSGAAEVGSDWPGYWQGRNTALDIMGSDVMGFHPLDQAIWLYAGGGMKFYDEIFGGFGIKYFPHHIHDQESGFRTSKPIRTLQDFQGLKLRAGSLMPGKILQKLGAQPVQMVSEDVYEAVQRGVIDGGEINMPFMDYGIKIHEVAKYWLTPGWHQTYSQHGILFNKAKYDALPDDLKRIIEEAARSNYIESFAITTLGSIKATEDMLKEGVVTTKLTPEEYATLEKLRDEVYLEAARENPDFARVLRHRIDFDKNLAQYRKNTAPWSFGRAWVSYPDLGGLEK